jgi:hypothetical protein
MKTIEINLYKFSELSEESKKRAINDLYDINVDYDWWDDTYDDAKNIGLKITGFDLDRNKHCTGMFIDSAVDCATKIKEEHGKECETYKTADLFLNSFLPAKEQWEKDNEGWYYEDEPEAQDAQGEFLKSILEDYATILQDESEYLTSEPAIIETIESNNYDFTENGKLY